MNSEEYNEILFKAHLSDMSERYEDMAEEMKLVVKIAAEKKTILTSEARNSFSVAYKYLVSSRRSSWRILCSEKQKLEAKGSSNIRLIDEKITKIEAELLKYCDEVLEIIDTYIFYPELVNDDVEYSIFFHKMKGDYYRYKAEVVRGDDEKIIASKAHEAYREATAKAEPLASTNPIKLGLSLNCSVFYYEILNDPKEACSIARTAFSNAIENLEGLSEEHYRDSTLIMQLLRDNLTLWNSRTPEAMRISDDPKKEFTDSDEH
ncbi:14-3-3 like protein [Nosema granulosis]|uniref:14-3-3 like protein n=1 Tax=Nosema granulosis TaxID=83296 RepID=A0A9P6L0C4_9MICR|nr:14-3-3 like protein [Nosema granulosis]